MPDPLVGPPGTFDAATRESAQPVAARLPTPGSRSPRIDAFEVTFHAKTKQIEPMQFNVTPGSTDLIFLLQTVGDAGDERARFGRTPLEWRNERSAAQVFGPPQVVGESRVLCSLRDDNANRGSVPERYEFNFVIFHAGRIYRPAPAIVNDPPVRSLGGWRRLFSWLHQRVETRLPA